jgi:hypothetical protein
VIKTPEGPRSIVVIDVAEIVRQVQQERILALTSAQDGVPHPLTGTDESDAIEYVVTETDRTDDRQMKVLRLDGRRFTEQQACEHGELIAAKNASFVTVGEVRGPQRTERLLAWFDGADPEPDFDISAFVAKQELEGAEIWERWERESEERYAA